MWLCILPCDNTQTADASQDTAASAVDAATNAMMLFEGDLELHTDGLLDLGLVNSVSKCGNHGMDMGRHGARDFWGIFSKDIHITPTPFSVPLQTRGREDLYNSFCDINKVF